MPENDSAGLFYGVAGIIILLMIVHGIYRIIFPSFQDSHTRKYCAYSITSNAYNNNVDSGYAEVIVKDRELVAFVTNGQLFTQNDFIEDYNINFVRKDLKGLTKVETHNGEIFLLGIFEQGDCTIKKTR